MSSNLFTPSLRYTNKDTCNSSWTFIDGQNVSDIEVPKFIKNLFTSFDDSRYGKMGKDLIEGAGTGESCNYNQGNTPTFDCEPNNRCLEVPSAGGTPNIGDNVCSDGSTNGCKCVATDSGDPCQSVTCGDNASCIEGGSGDGYTCTCNDGFYGAATPGGPATCTACTPVTNASSVTCSEGNNSRATCSVGFHVTDNSASNSSDTCTPDADDDNITCTRPSSIPDHVNSATLPHSATFSSSTGELSSGLEINPSCAAGYSESPTLSCNTAGPYGITGCGTATCTPNPCQNGGSCTLNDDSSSYTCECPTGYTGVNCETEDQTTYKCSSAFEGAKTGKDQPCNLNDPDSAGWTKGNLDDDPLWAKYDTSKDNSSLTEDESDTIKALITSNTEKQSSDKPGPMDQNLWNKCCIKAGCTDDGWDDISITGTDGSWTAWMESLGCTFTSSDDPQ